MKKYKSAFSPKAACKINKIMLWNNLYKRVMAFHLIK